MIVAALLATQIGQATQSCGWEFGRWVCRDVGPPPTTPLNPHPQRERPPLVIPRQQGETEEQRYSRFAIQVMREMNAGDCDRAQATALVSGYQVLIDLSHRAVCAPVE